MTYTANQLITDAYYTSDIVSREFETPTGGQLTDGLRFLNDLIGDKALETNLVPYLSKFNLNAIVGQTDYFIPNLVSIETYTFFINNIRYSTYNVNFKKFQGCFRAVDVKSLPWQWNARRVLGGMLLSVYFVPDVAYPMEIYGQFSLSEVTQFQDLSISYDRYYINYLKFELADRLCTEFGYLVPDSVSKQLFKYQKMIDENLSSKDLTIEKISTMGQQESINYFLLLTNGFIPTY